jgi:aerobic carbon-monoxide dehydrogenase large subunit
MNREAMEHQIPASPLGQPVRRLEDIRFLTGRGRYVDDIVPHGAAYAVFCRSDHAHARLARIDTSEARQMPGVLAVLTGSDWAEAGLGRFEVWSPVRSRDGSTAEPKTQPILATESVHYVGQPIALVIAESLPQAQDAAERVEIDYVSLEPVVAPAAAVEPGAPVLHTELGSNLAYDVEVGDEQATRDAFKRAFHVTELTLVNNRITANPIEPRALVAQYDAGTDEFTLFASHQAPHILRRELAEGSLRHPEHKIRVVAPDVGGGFGMKVANHPEDPAVLWASKVTGRPVKWTCTRSEAQLADSQARDHFTRCRMAFDAEGRILALEADTCASLGAFQTRLGASIPAQFYSRTLIGLYTTPAAWCRVRGVYTNTPPIQSYRGAGRPEAVYVLESLLENGAREMGIDICEIRRRNFIPASAFPYATPLGLTYDSGNPEGLLREADKLFDYAATRERQRRHNASGARTRIGIGAACFADCVGTPSKIMAAYGRKKVGGWDSATVRIMPTGKVEVLAGSHSHGQGHATAYAQVVADRLGCPVPDVNVVEGDTARVQFGWGTWGSRSTVTTGMAVEKAAAQLHLKCTRIAAKLVECDPGDLERTVEGYRIIGTDRSVTWGEVIGAAYQGGALPQGMDPGLELAVVYDPPDRATSSGFHFCEVAVDLETGRVSVQRYTAIDDCGRIINPMIIEGQAHGGLAQGIGQALMEDCVFDPATGQPLAGSFMDYAMPRASDFPFFDTGVQETPCPSNVLGAKGAGESGTIGALGAVRNAVVDALWDLGVRHVQMPMTAARVWEAINAAGAKS